MGIWGVVVPGHLESFGREKLPFLRAKPSDNFNYIWRRGELLPVRTGLGKLVAAAAGGSENR